MTLPFSVYIVIVILFFMMSVCAVLVLFLQDSTGQAYKVGDCWYIWDNDIILISRGSKRNLEEGRIYAVTHLGRFILSVRPL